MSRGISVTGGWRPKHGQRRNAQWRLAAEERVAQLEAEMRRMERS